MKLVNAGRNTTKLGLAIFYVMAQPVIQRVHISHQLALLFQRGQVHESVLPNHGHHIIENRRQNDRLSEWLRDWRDAPRLTKLNLGVGDHTINRPKWRSRRSWLIPRA